jgi:protein-disulfide isomerase
MKKKLPSIIIIGLIVVVVGFIIYAMLKPDSQTSNGRPKVAADPAKLSEGNFQGPADAKVTLSEFGDYQCPACGKYYPELKNNILPPYQGRIKFVFLNYPLPIHQNAVPAAQAAEAAGLQGKFWEMHDLLYEKQDDWVKQSNPQAKFESYAKGLGLNPEQFKQDYASQKIKDLINNQAALGDAFNIPGTPTFFVNGKQVDTSSGSDSIKQAIDKALAQ